MDRNLMGRLSAADIAQRTIDDEAYEEKCRLEHEAIMQEIADRPAARAAFREAERAASEVEEVKSRPAPKRKRFSLFSK